MPQPEQRARERIDQLLQRTGWTVCDAGQVNLSASRGIAIREFPLKPSHGFADYLSTMGKTFATVFSAVNVNVYICS